MRHALESVAGGLPTVNFEKRLARVSRARFAQFAAFPPNGFSREKNVTDIMFHSSSLARVLNRSCIFAHF